MSIGIDILQDLHLSRFVAIDIETTGLDYLTETIIEFAAVRFVNGQATEEISFFINPGRSIPEYICKITGIQNDDVKDAPAFQEVAEDILSFIGDDPIVGHNVGFDANFLEYHFRKLKGMGEGEKIKHYLILTNDMYDTLLLSRMFLPFLSGFSLEKVGEYFDVSAPEYHRALPDARTAGEIFLKLVEISLGMEFQDVRKILEILEPTDEPIKTFFFHLSTLLASGKYSFPATLNKEMFMYSTSFFNIIGENEAPQSGTLQVEPIDEQEIAEFFDEGGILQQSFGTFELREAQVEMARSVAHAFNEQQFLVVEAGTGTGKSLAYLLPAIKWSVKNYGPLGRVIISTNTKNLQEQLFFKDIPILHSILKEKFKAVLLKGKGNYLCLDKWYTILHDMRYRLSTYERVKILPLYLWVKNTETGDISENSGFSVERNMGLWSKFIAENNYCPGKSCKYYKDCFLMRARNNARDAHLVLVNHSLLFSDLAADQAILAEYKNVIFDEAHNIEKVATDYLGIELSRWNFRETLQKLYQKERIETGVVVQLKKRTQLSDLNESLKKLIISHCDKIIDQTSTGWKLVQQFFDEMHNFLQQLVPRDNSQEYSTRYRYRKEDGLHQHMESYYNEFLQHFRGFLSELNELLEAFKDIPEDALKYQKQMLQEVQAQFGQISDLLDNLQFLLHSEWDNWVYWFELTRRNNVNDVRLYAAPLNISDLLYHKLYKNLNTAVFTSATLTVGRRFDYFLDRVGLKFVEPERLQTLLLPSPFNYEEQVLLAVPAFFPDPRSPQFREYTRDFLLQLNKEQKRGTLVLFTSYALLNEIYHALKMKYEMERTPLLAQGIDGSRHRIITQFKEVAHSVLFGTDSFWEGVDVPGKALEILLITKLPFDVPSDPVIQAKMEMIRKQGGNPFMDFTVPEAVIRFRQGFGRLIRSHSDYGAVIILDNRVVKKMYGRIFLDSLPVRSRIFHKPQELWETLANWFR